MRPIPHSKRVSLYNCQPEMLIRVYSYQHLNAYINARELGYFTGSHNYNFDKEFMETWYPCYDWMRSEMSKAIPDFSGDLPMWAYLKRNNNRTDVDKNEVRITALIPRKRILFSDFDLWHIPLNNGPICDSEEEFDNFNGDITETWYKCLDITKNIKDGWNKSSNYIQACIDRIYLNEIVSVRYY